jgi:hypothetical protein
MEPTKSRRNYCSSCHVLGGLMACSDCSSKNLNIWFESKTDSRALCDKCFLKDAPVRGKK